jgi:uncharacterized protein
VKVAFTDISRDGNFYEIHDDSWFPAKEIYRTLPVETELTLNRKGKNRVEVRGFLRTGVRLKCDRCLADYDFAVDIAFHLILEVPAEEHWCVKELECSDQDLDTVLLLDPVVDFGDILRQQLYLSLPDKWLCSQECKGLCPSCGIDLNRAICSCVQEVPSSPFAVLASLKKSR